jgi:hypothetical protein
VVDSLGRNESGVYTCMATITTTSPLFRDSASNNGTARITVGKAIIYLVSLIIPRLYSHTVTV